MNKVRLRVKKELEKVEERKIINLKGHLIAAGYTDIIHIDDLDDHYYVNSFSTDSRHGAITFIENFIVNNLLSSAVMVLKD